MYPAALTDKKVKPGNSSILPALISLSYFQASHTLVAGLLKVSFSDYTHLLVPTVGTDALCVPETIH
jgi:hypothetical protein